MDLVDAPPYAPAVCCLTSQGGPLIDTHRQVANFGHAYLHPDVVREAAAALGMVDGSALDAAIAAVEERAAMVGQLEDALADVAEKYNNLQGALAELMQHGVTVDRKGTIRYRVCKPGDRVLKED
jgi:hypothetical protein